MTIARGYDALKKVNEGPGVLNCQLEANHESQRGSLETYNSLYSQILRTQKAQDQMARFQERLNTQPRQI